MSDTATTLHGECPRCGETARLRARTFSDQALAALVAWQEVTEAVVGQAICDDCYGELREVLIDRHDELSDGALPISANVPERVGHKAAPGNSAAAKAAPANSAAAKLPATPTGKRPSGKSGQKAG